jgi:hypothetical protein
MTAINVIIVIITNLRKDSSSNEGMLGWSGFSHLTIDTRLVHERDGITSLSTAVAVSEKVELVRDLHHFYRRLICLFSL